jgi:glycosyltransferase involved in cell wall biosynthesis
MAHELQRTDNPVAVDIYDPFHLENLEMGGPDRSEADRAVARLTGVINAALRRGDFFACASERQRDFWLGSLAAVGRVNPYTYDVDPLLDQLISVVPFGLPSEPPQRQGPGLRGVVPGIGPDDKVVLWGGGVYNWLDPVSVLRAADRLRRRLPELRLVFLGMQHPNPDVPRMHVATRLQELAAELGLTGKYVFFNAGWVPYARRADFLLDADVAVSTHLHHLETRYAFRSRVLDYLWAGLPMVLTGGDVLAEEISRARLGVTVPAGEDEMLEEALAQMLASPPPHQLFAAVARRHTWERAAKPLLEFCSAPRRAPDLTVERLSPEAAANQPDV